MAITSYGTHQVLLFPNYTQMGFLSFGKTASPPYSLNVNNASLQGPDGLLVYPSASNISTLYGYTPVQIPNCTSTQTSPALLVADGINNAIYIFCGFNPAQPGPPTITISGGNTQLTSPEGLSIDTLDNNGNPLSAPILFVANSGAGGGSGFRPVANQGDRKPESLSIRRRFARGCGEHLQRPLSEQHIAELPGRPVLFKPAPDVVCVGHWQQ